MRLKFKNTGSTVNFATWLKGFKDIASSIIIEVDPTSEEFIAKSFPESKFIVKYSKISFDESGLELVSMTDNSNNPIDWQNDAIYSANRVKIAIRENFNKFIDVINMFSETEHEMDVNFNVNKNVMYSNSRSSEQEFQAETVVLKSLSLTMSIKTAPLNEHFQKLDDNTFLNVVCKVNSPTSFEVSSDILTNLNKISSIYSIDKSRDTIKFYSKVVDGNRALYAYDETNGSYDYLLGYFVSGEDMDTAIHIYKENFINATKALVGEKINITMDTAGSSRLLINTEDNCKIIIASVKNN